MAKDVDYRVIIFGDNDYQVCDKGNQKVHFAVTFYDKEVSAEHMLELFEKIVANYYDDSDKEDNDES